jgi:alpha-galactosidase/6-phospho-beta-glucosidase family protein
MTNQHTPGPYTVRKARTHFYIESKYRLIAVVRFLGINHGAWTSEVDANLLGAAPEMFDAIKWAEMHLARGDYTNDQVRGNVLDALRAAIAKATGSDA